MWQFGMPGSMNIRRSLLMLVAVATGDAQPRQLATDHTGSVLYFTASMTTHGDAQTGLPGIFRWDHANGFRVFAITSQPLDPRVLMDPRFRTTTLLGLGSPSVTADGSTVFYVARIGCGLCVPFVNFDQVVAAHRDGY